MKIVLHSEEDLEFSAFEQPQMEIEARDAEARYSALQMFATALAHCTYSVLAYYGEQIHTGTADLSMRIRWSYADDPLRIADIDMDIRWPGLPHSRLKAAQRAAEQCTLHNTLAHPPQVTTELVR